MPVKCVMLADLMHLVAATRSALDLSNPWPELMHKWPDLKLESVHVWARSDVGLSADDG